MTQTITAADVRAAFRHHVETLERVGITYDGRLEIAEGSRTYGIAYRIYRTGYTVRDADGSSRATSGHANPPIGSDYLGMTRREAYETLQTRTRAVSDTADALERSSRG